MFVELTVSILVGITLGIFTGLTPGIHINLVSVTILSLAPILLNYTNPLSLAVLIVAMAVTHTFLDTIPSVFLGAPEPNTVLSVLPGHKLLLEGQGYAAVMLTVIGSFGALVVSIILSPILLEAVSAGYPYIKPYIGYVLILICIYLILKEKGSKIWAAAIFFISGCLGLTVFSLKTLEDPLFPLLSGLFGISTLLLSLKNKVMIPKQVTAKNISGYDFKTILSSVIAGWVCSFMPGLGPSEAAILASQFHKKLETKGFLVLIGGLGTTNMALSFVTFYSIGKARNGAVVAISKIIENFNLDNFIIFLAVSLVAGGIAVILAAKLSKKFAEIITKVSYKKICLTIISFVTILVFLLTGFLGLVVLIISTLVGLLPTLKGIGRHYMMGCLLIPVISYFLL